MGAIAKPVHVDFARGPITVKDNDILRIVWRTRPYDCAGSRHVCRLPYEPVRCQLPRGRLSDKGSRIGPVGQDALQFRAVQREGSRRVDGLGMLRVERDQIRRACEAGHAIRTVDRDRAVGSCSMGVNPGSHGRGRSHSAPGEYDARSEGPDDRPEIVAHANQHGFEYRPAVGGPGFEPGTVGL